MGIDFSHCKASWSYGGFSKFRHRIAEECGLDVAGGDMYEYGQYKKLSTHDIYPFIDHSDCEGDMSVENMKKVAPAIRKAVEQWDENDYDKMMAIRLVECMEEAISKNEPIQFI